jgi:hypothetical protein
VAGSDVWESFACGECKSDACCHASRPFLLVVVGPLQIRYKSATNLATNRLRDGVRQIGVATNKAPKGAICSTICSIPSPLQNRDKNATKERLVATDHNVSPGRLASFTLTPGTSLR